MKSRILFFSLALSTQAWSAPKDLVVSPEAARTSFSSDYQKLVDASFPQYSDAELATRLMQASRTLQARKDQVSVRSTVAIERLMGFAATNSRESEVSTDKAYYRVHRLDGRAYAHHKNDAYMALAQAKFFALQPAVMRNQRSFISTLGLPDDEIMKVSFKQVLVRGSKEGDPNNSDGSPVEVRRGMTLAYRGFAGFPIENNFARISSYDDKRVETFSLNWQVFKLYPTIKTMDLAASAVIKRNIAEKVRLSANAKDVSVFMGVVFLPVRGTDQQLHHVPSMKVVVTPRANTNSDGKVQTDAGQVFFTNILKVAVPVNEGDSADNNLNERSL